jgi:cysteine desulfurase/selenocysteine lyase
MIAEAVGLGAAIDYLNGIGLPAIASWELSLLDHATRRLGEIDGLRPIGTAQHKASIVSFVLQGVHPHDLGTVLDDSGVAIRAGHHCAQPLVRHFGVPATARASFAFYNTPSEVDVLVESLHGVARMFR